jgi:hypothetical protein
LDWNHKILLYISGIIFSLVPQKLNASIRIDFELKSDQQVIISTCLPVKSGNNYYKILQFLQNALKNDYPSYKLEFTECSNEVCINFEIKNVMTCGEELNFIDYRYSKSFIKEKYYLKILLNSQILDSRIFGIFEVDTIDFDLLYKEFYWYDEIDIYFKLPGNFVESNLEYTEDSYIDKLTLSEIKKNGRMISIHTARFLPGTYISIYFILVILIFLFIKSIFFNKS